MLEIKYKPACYEYEILFTIDSKSCGVYLNDKEFDLIYNLDLNTAVLNLGNYDNWWIKVLYKIFLKYGPFRFIEDYNIYIDFKHIDSLAKLSV